MIYRKKLLLIFFSLICKSFFFSQDSCDNVIIDSNVISLYKKLYYLKITNFEIVNNIYKNISFKLICHEEYLEIICIMKNGNEYYIENKIYIKDKEFFIYAYQYCIYSNRNNYKLYGSLGNGKKIDSVHFNDETNRILLTETIEMQTNLKTISYFENLIKSQKSNSLLLNLLAFSIISGIEQINVYNIKTVNKLALKLYKTKNYINSISLLKKCLIVFPNNSESLITIAENYLELGDKINAKIFYKKYLSSATHINLIEQKRKRAIKRALLF